MLEICIFRAGRAAGATPPYLGFLAPHWSLPDPSVQLLLLALDLHQTLGLRTVPEAPGLPHLAAQGHPAHPLGPGPLQDKVPIRLFDSFYQILQTLLKKLRNRFFTLKESSIFLGILLVSCFTQRQIRRWRYDSV